MKAEAKHRQNTQPARSRTRCALHVVGPLVRAVVLVAVALDRQPSVVVPLHHHVDAVLADPHLWRHPVATLREFVVHLAFEGRLTKFAQIFHAHFILCEGCRKVSDETAPQPVRRAQMLQPTERTRYIRSFAREAATLKRWAKVSRESGAPTSLGADTMERNMMSRSLP